MSVCRIGASQGSDNLDFMDTHKNKDEVVYCITY